MESVEQKHIAGDLDSVVGELVVGELVVVDLTVMVVRVVLVWSLMRLGSIAHSSRWGMMWLLLTSESLMGGHQHSQFGFNVYYVQF